MPRAGLEPNWGDRKPEAGCAVTFYRFDITRVRIPSSSVLSRCVSLQAAPEGDIGVTWQIRKSGTGARWHLLGSARWASSTAHSASPRKTCGPRLARPTSNDPVNALSCADPNDRV
jgi:hypothetical protein